MNTKALKVYEILKESWGEKKATTVIEYLENGIEEKIRDGRLATREDILEVRNEISRTRADVIKWMFIFWVGTIGIFFALMKFLQT